MVSAKLDRTESWIRFVQMALPGLSVQDRIVVPPRPRRPKECPEASAIPRRARPHGSRHGHRGLPADERQLSFPSPPAAGGPGIDERVRGLVASAVDVARALDISSELRRIVAKISAPTPTPAPQPAAPPELDDDYPDHRPATYAECRALGLGTERPCPYYSCRAHLGLYVRGDGSMRMLIDPESIDAEGQHTCVHAASAREWAPIDIANQLHISLGLEELIQRHGVAKTGGLLGRYKDERSRCEMDVAGARDCRR